MLLALQGRVERAAIVVWGLDGCTPERNKETLYLGMSRAKSLLFLWHQGVL